MTTDAMKSALKWFRNRGGDGCFAEQNHVVLIASGERAPVMRSTWNRLEAEGLVEHYPRNRLRLTEAGRVLDLSDVEESA